MDIAAGLDAAVPTFVDLVVAEADVGAASKAMRCLGADRCLMLTVALGADDAALFGS